MKIHYSFFISALLLVACNKQIDEDIISENPQKGGVTYMTVNLLSNLKTYMDEDKDAGNKHKIYWSNGDQIAVNGTASHSLENVAEKSQGATFAFDGIINPPYNILYPAADYTDETHITLPAVQTYAEGGFAEAMLPMAGYSADYLSVSLNHLCAILKIQIKRAGTNPDIHNLYCVRFKGRGGEQVCGSFSIDYELAKLTGTSDLSTDKVISVCQVLPTSTDEATVYYLIVPAGEYSSGFDVTVMDVNGHYMVKHKTSAQTLEAGHIYSMAEFEFVPTGTEIGIIITSKN